MGVVDLSEEIEISMSMSLFLQGESLLEYVMASKEYFLKEQNKHELTFQYKL